MTTTPPRTGDQRAVADGFSRLTVVTDRRRVDLSLPDTVPIAELLPEIAELVELAGTPVVLTLLGGDPIPVDGTLAAAGLRDGQIVYLVPLGREPAAAVVDDIVVAVGDETDARGGRWGAGANRLVLLAAGATLAALAAPALLLQHAGRPVTLTLLALAAVIGVAPTVVLAALRPAHEDRAELTAAVLTAVPLWVGGAIEAGRAGGLGPAGLVAATAGGLAVAAAGATASGRLRWTAAPVLVGTAAAALAALGAALAGSPLAPAAAGVLIGGLLLTAAVPPLALRLTGLSRAAAESATGAPGEPGGLSVVMQTRVAVRTRTAHRLTTAGLVGLTGLCALAAVALAVSAGVYGLALAAVTVPLALLRARAYRFTALIAPWLVLATAAGVGLLARLLLTYAAHHPALVAVPLAVGAVVAAGGGVVARLRLTATTVSWLDRLQLLLTVALVPLALGAIGLYGDATDAGVRLH